MWPIFRRRGALLLDILMYAGLLGLVVTVLYTVLTVSLRYHRFLLDASESQQQAMLACRELSQTMSGGAEASLRSDANGILFLSAEGPLGRFQHDASGSILWQKYVCFYLDNGSLMRKDAPIVPTTQVATDAPAIATLRADATLRAQRVASGIVLLECSSGPPAALRVTARSAANRTNETSIQTKLRFRQ